MQENLKFTMDSPIMAGLLKSMNEVIERTVCNMMQKGSYVAVVTSKVTINCDVKEVPDTCAGGYRQSLVPMIEHKVSSVLQIKDSANGTWGGAYEVAYDEDIGEYVARPLKTAQISMFDQGQSGDDPDDDKPAHPNPQIIVGLPAATVTFMDDPEEGGDDPDTGDDDPDDEEPEEEEEEEDEEK